MIPLDDKNIFEQYYQASYDFNTASLNVHEIDEIRDLVKEKRVNYALAPIGVKIFDFITEQCPHLNFELVEFDTDKIDGMLYIPVNGEDKAYIILNGKKPFINQIFAAAHEYYHYIYDYETVKKKPYVCSLSSLNSTIEKKASRFAAEILLPEEALRKEIRFYKNKYNWFEKKECEFDEYAYISVILTLKYQLPLKAVIYRLHEEKYIGNIKKFIDNYSVIKCFLMQIDLLINDIELLYSNKNKAIDNSGIIYQQIEMAYKNGLASRDEIIRDSISLNLNEKVIHSFFDEIDESDEADDDSEILTIMKNKWEDS